MFDVKIRLTTDLLGTVPKNKEIFSTYIETKKPKNQTEEETENIEEIEEAGWTGFMQDEKGIFIYDYMIRGFLKNAGNILKDELKLKNLRSKISDRVFIFPRKIYLGKSEPDGVLERPLRGMTAKGPRVSLARSDYIAAQTEISFSIDIIGGGKEITENLIWKLLEYGKYCGLGQWRNGSYGRFEVMKN